MSIQIGILEKGIKPRHSFWEVIHSKVSWESEQLRIFTLEKVHSPPQGKSDWKRKDRINICDKKKWEAVYVSVREELSSHGIQAWRRFKGFHIHKLTKIFEKYYIYFCGNLTAFAGKTISGYLLHIFNFQNLQKEVRRLSAVTGMSVNPQARPMPWVKMLACVLSALLLPRNVGISIYLGKFKEGRYKMLLMLFSQLLQQSVREWLSLQFRYFCILSTAGQRKIEK